MSFRFDLNTLILFGPGSIKELGEEAAKLGHKAIIVTYPDIRRIGLLDKVFRDLEDKNIEVTVFDKVEPNPRRRRECNGCR
jgi:alcohol dehydrogenase class IV